MPRGARKDDKVTKCLRQNGLLADKRSFISWPSATDGEVHLYLKGKDIEYQRARVHLRDGGHCQLKLAGCEEATIEMDHKQGGLYGRCDCLHNLQMACRSCHRKKHVHVQWTKAEAKRDFEKLYGQEKTDA